VRELVFGVTWQSDAEPIGSRMADLTRRIGHDAGVRLVPRVALSYEELGRMARAGSVHVAWAPPVLLFGLERDRTMSPVVAMRRGEPGTTFASALVVLEDSRAREPADLRGARAVWVDPYSAAGCVVARLELFRRGLDPRKLFLEERFRGSHDAALRSLLRGTGEVTATYAHYAADGRLVRAGFLDLDAEDAARFRVLAHFGDIPTDVIAARQDVDAGVVGALRAAFVRLGEDAEGRALLEAAFGADGVTEGPDEAYGKLRGALAEAAEAGLLPE
jgi:ABC-type phosphate/phosphonate transport system substrate-binding protein